MAGYYDSEGAEKCSKMRGEYEKFCADLQERQAKSKEQYNAYSQQFKNLSDQYQEKISQHNNKFDSD